MVSPYLTCMDIADLNAITFSLVCMKNVQSAVVCEGYVFDLKREITTIEFRLSHILIVLFF